MKHIILLLFLIPLSIRGQFRYISQLRYIFEQEHFFGFQPSARMEAMGRSYVSVDNDLACINYNPAGISTLKGLTANYSYTPPGYYTSKAYYQFAATGLQVKKFNFAVSKYRFDYGKTPMTDGYDSLKGSVIVDARPFSERNTITLTYKLLKDLQIGFNINHLRWSLGYDKSANMYLKPVNSFYFDIGAIRKIGLFKKKNPDRHSLDIALSMTNVTDAKIKWTYRNRTYNHTLPIISRYGLSYCFKPAILPLIDSLKTLKLLVSLEYQDVLNAPFETAYRCGGEMTFLEILSLRAGYYKTTVNDYNYPLQNKNRIKALTYGIGLNIPLDKFSRLPCSISLDYARLPQPGHSQVEIKPEYYNTITCQLNWMLRTKTQEEKK